MPFIRKSSDRRRFLGFLAASPLIAGAGAAAGGEEQAPSGSEGLEVLEGRPLGSASPDLSKIQSVKELAAALRGDGRKEALNIFDFERAAYAKKSLPGLRVGAFNSETLKANRDGFGKYQIRFRRLMGMRDVDQSVQVFGVKYDSPVFLCPVGPLSDYHAEGSVAVARASGATNTLHIYSNGWPNGIGRPGNDGGAALGSQPIEAINAARGAGGPAWFNVGSPTTGKGSWDGAIKALIPRVEKAGCQVLVWTVDRRPEGPPLDGATNMRDAEYDWDDVKRVKAMTRMKLVLKGVVTGEDAALAVKNGVDGIIVSTHGGHHDAGARGAIECLPEVVAAVGGKIPVLMDGGVRGGADVFKALALGATAVGIGRAQAWGLASFGQEGVQTVIEILRRELRTVMAQTGARSIAEIKRASLQTRV